jgi:hypothetical protein
MEEHNMGAPKEKTTLFFIGLALSVAGIIAMFAFGSGLSFTIGLVSTAIGFIFFGVGLRSRIMKNNLGLGNIVLLVTSLSSVIMIAWYLLL